MSLATEQRLSHPGASMAARLRALRHAATPFAILSLAVALVLAFLALYPLLRVVQRLFWADGAFDATAALAVYAQAGTATVLLNTVIAVAASALVSVVVGSVLAWINERTDARIGIVTDVLPLLPFLVPPIAGAIGWVFLLSDRSGFVNALLRALLNQLGFELTQGPLNIYSWPGLVFTYVIYSVPYVYLVVSAGLRNVDAALEEQSRICGRGAFQTMLRVTIPAVKPSLGAALLLLVWFGFSLFSVPAIIGTGARIEVLAVRLVRLVTFTYPPDMTGAIGLGMIVVLAVGTAWALQTRIIAACRHATIGGKGGRSTRIALGRWKHAARAFLLAYILIAAVLPLAALLIVALNGFWTPSIRWHALNLNTFREVLFEDALTAQALRNSLVLGVIGATIGIAAAAILALFVRRHGAVVGRALDAAIKLPASISNIVLAVGFVLAFSGPPFYLNGTFAILLLAYLALYMPQASVAADAAAAQVGKELMEASRIAGAAAGRTFWRIGFPLMAAGLAAGWALLFVRMISDLTASAVLAGTSNPVVGFRILEIYDGASFATLAALSSVLTLITALVITALLALSRRRQRSPARAVVAS